MSVPGLGISGDDGGSKSRPRLPPPVGSGRVSTNPLSPAAAGASGVAGLQSRFGMFGIGGGSGGGGGGGAAASPPAAEAPAQGTTWAQKQAALRTMSDFKKNPSSVSLSDAKSAASTANNFRQRHGEQVAAGYQKANTLDQKYGVSGKAGGYLSSSGNDGAATTAGGGNTAQSHLSTIGAAANGVLGKKKPPPPPPPKKKKPVFGGNDGAGEDAPPPVPMATRPNF